MLLKVEEQLELKGSKYEFMTKSKMVASERVLFERL